MVQHTRFATRARTRSTLSIDKCATIVVYICVLVPDITWLCDDLMMVADADLYCGLRFGGRAGLQGSDGEALVACAGVLDYHRGPRRLHAWDIWSPVENCI